MNSRQQQSATVLRRTSIYTVDVPTDDPWKLIDKLVARCPVTITATATDRMAGTASVRFRTRDDVDAMAIAAEIADGRPHSVRTGYGIAARTVGEVAREERCHCSGLPEASHPFGWPGCTGKAGS